MSPEHFRIFIKGEKFPGLTMSRAFGDFACAERGVIQVLLRIRSVPWFSPANGLDPGHQRNAPSAGLRRTRITRAPPTTEG